MILEDLRTGYRAGKIDKQEYIRRMHEVHMSLFDYSEFLRDTDISRIEISDRSVIMTSRSTGIRMVCDRADMRIVPIEILNLGSFGKEDFDVILALIKDGMTVFDIGANVGWYSLNVIRARPNVNLYAFEPVPRTFRLLKRNLELNDEHAIKVFDFGFSNESGTVTFFYTPDCSGNASLENVSGARNVEEVAGTIRRLDDFTSETGLRVDFIKCDVEGAELLVFQGGIETIRRCRPIIFTEMMRKWSAKFHYHPNDIVRLLADCGYRCFTFHGNNRLRELSGIDERTEESNFTFLHSEKHAPEIAAMSP